MLLKESVMVRWLDCAAVKLLSRVYGCCRCLHAEEAKKKNEAEQKRQAAEAARLLVSRC